MTGLGHSGSAGAKVTLAASQALTGAPGAFAQPNLTGRLGEEEGEAPVSSSWIGCMGNQSSFVADLAESPLSLGLHPSSEGWLPGPDTDRTLTFPEITEM